MEYPGLLTDSWLESPGLYFSFGWNGQMAKWAKSTRPQEDPLFALSYELHVYISTLTKFIYWNPNTSVVVFDEEDFGRWIHHKGEALMMGLVPL